MEFSHKPVLLNEAIEALGIKANGIYIDGTAGGGGHSSAILDKLNGGMLISIDQDPDAIKVLNQRLSCYKESTIVQANFSEIFEITQRLGISSVDGVLLDIGVSSHQLDTKERGFSYHHEAPLDMRMSQSGVSAYDLVNTLTLQDLTRIIRTYGEEKYAKRIAMAIVQNRENSDIKTTTELAEIIKLAVPAMAREGKHPARKTFQALRIEVNEELKVLEKGLDAAFEVLKSGGRLAVITFHSLEDRIVKNKMADWCRGCICPPDFPICVCGNKPKARLLNKKAIVASEEELKENPRSRSAKLRVCTKF